MSGIHQALLGGGNQALDIGFLYGSSAGFWADFTDASTVFSDTAGTTPATPGATMRSIRSKAPAADLFSVNPAQDWPWTADSNGALSADLDGTKNWLQGVSSPILDTGAFTQVVLVTYVSGARSVVDSDIVGNRAFQGLEISGGSAYYQLFKPSNVVGDSIGAGSFSAGPTYVTSLRAASSAAFSVRVNRSQVNSGTLTHALPSGYSPSILIGAASLNSGGSQLQKYYGRIYCVMMIGRYLTDAEVLAVETEMLRAADAL